MIVNGLYKTVGYGTKIDDFDRGTVSVVSMKELEKIFINNLDNCFREKNTFIIYLYVDKDSRIKKMIERGDEESEVLRRAEDDEKWIKIISQLLNENDYFKNGKYIKIENNSYKLNPDEIIEIILDNF